MTSTAEEIAHWQAVKRAFDGYMRYHLSANHSRRMAFLSLPKESKEMLNGIGYREKLDAVDEGIRRNSEFIDEMIAEPVFSEAQEGLEGDLEDSSPQMTHAHHEELPEHVHAHDPVSPHSHSHTQDTAYGSSSRHKGDSRNAQAERDQSQDKVRSTLRSFVRDWSVEGVRERQACYDPCLEALERHFSRTTLISEAHGVMDTEGCNHEKTAKRARGSVRVLVPGCGLGRLAMEIAARGFACQGNEFSSYMLMASHWVLNSTTRRHSHAIYPFLHSFSNHLSTMHNLLHRVQIPDVCPADVLGNGKGGEFSLVAGDFEEIYGPKSWKLPHESIPDGQWADEGKVNQKGRWGAVVTCFFIDCARNVLNFLKIIHTILEDDGVWINIGPLLWHFENSPTTSATGEGSIELSLDEVKELARREEKMIRSTYTGIPDGMLKHEYNAAFWVATKRTVAYYGNGLPLQDTQTEGDGLSI